LHATDVFDALTSERVYKKPMPPLDAREMINLESGKHFDPEIVVAFNECWEPIHKLAKRNGESPNPDPTEPNTKSVNGNNVTQSELSKPVKK